MSDFSKPSLAAIEGVVHAQWSDCTVLFRASQGSWFNWRDRLSAGDLTTPFGVISVLAEEEAENWGPANKVYTQTVGFYYVRDAELSAGEISGGATKVEDLIYPKMAALRDALLAYNTTPTGPAFQPAPDLPKLDLGLTNPANEYFSINGDTYWAGELVMKFLVGEGY